MRISDWSSDVCSSDLLEDVERVEVKESEGRNRRARGRVNLEHAVVGSVGIGDRQAVGAERARAREARGNAGARTAGAAAVAVDLFDREGTRALIDGVGLLVTDAQHRVAAAVVEFGADRGVDAENVAERTSVERGKVVEVRVDRGG